MYNKPPAGTRIILTNHPSEFNGKIGTVIDRMTEPGRTAHVADYELAVELDHSVKGFKQWRLVLWEKHTEQDFRIIKTITDICKELRDA